MFNIGSFIVAILVMVFFTWILLPSNSNERYSRACAPIQWTGNVAVSMASFIAPQGEAGTKKTFDSMDYACRFSIWRLFNEKDYQIWLKANPGGYQAQKAQPEAGQ